MQNEKEYWSYPEAEILKCFKVTEDGLTEENAEKILNEKGENVLREGKKKSVLQVFLGQERVVSSESWQEPVGMKARMNTGRKSLRISKWCR